MSGCIGSAPGDANQRETDHGNTKQPPQRQTPGHPLWINPIGARMIHNEGMETHAPAAVDIRYGHADRYGGKCLRRAPLWIKAIGGRMIHNGGRVRVVSYGGVGGVAMVDLDKKV